MPTTPYAKILVSIAGGAPTSGGVTATTGQTVQISFESTVGWSASSRTEIWGFPSGFVLPAGWSSETIDGHTTYYVLGNTNPPVFTLGAWGKYMLRLLVNGGGGDKTDTSTAITVLSPNGLKDMGHLEEGQFGGSAEKWAKDYRSNLRVIESLFGVPGATTVVQNGNTFGALMTIGTNDAFGLALEANNTEWARLLSTGEFGVGTTSAQAKFHVSTGAAATTRIVRLQNTAGDADFFVTTTTPEGAITGSPGDFALNTSGSAFIKASGSGTNTGWQQLATSANAFVQSGNAFGATAVLGTTDSQDVSFISGAEFLRGTQTGDVTIRTNLSVPTAQITGASATGTLATTTMSGTSTATGAANAVVFQIYNAGASNTRTRFLHGGNVTAEQWAIETDSAGNGTRDWAVVDLNTSVSRIHATSTGRTDLNSGVAATVAAVRINNTAGNTDLFVSTTSPEGVITGSPGNFHFGTNGTAYLKVSGSATNTGWKKLSTSHGDSVFGATTTSVAATRYLAPGGAFAAATATPECYQVTEACTAVALRVDITTAGTGTGGSNTFAYTLCTVDTSDVVTATSLTLTLDGDARFGSATGSVSLAAGTRITVRVVPAGTVTSWTNAKISIGLNA